MSKFFKALEQAELDRAFREQRDPRERDTAMAMAATESESIAHVERPALEASGRVEIEPVADYLERGADGVDEHMVSLLVPESFEAEQYRALRHLVEQLHKSVELSIIAVSSPSTGDGKTTTAINLAGALVQSRDARVLLVDADLRQPSIARYLGLDDPGPGLVAAILDPDLTLDRAARTRHPFNLSVLAAGRHPSTPYELFKSARFGRLFEEGRQRYDYIVLDTPPLLHVPDCQIISKYVDGFLIVVRAHKTPRKLLDEALKVIDPAKVVGIVCNGDDRRVAGYSYAYGPPAAATIRWAGRS